MHCKVSNSNFESIYFKGGSVIEKPRSFLIADGLEIGMVKFKYLFSAVEAAEKIMAEWSDEEEDNIDIVLLPPENIDAVTDDEEVDGNRKRRWPNDVSGTIEIQTNIP